MARLSIPLAVVTVAGAACAGGTELNDQIDLTTESTFTLSVCVVPQRHPISAGPCYGYSGGSTSYLIDSVTIVLHANHLVSWSEGTTRITRPCYLGGCSIPDDTTSGVAVSTATYTFDDTTLVVTWPQSFSFYGTNTLHLIAYPEPPVRDHAYASTPWIGPDSLLLRGEYNQQDIALLYLRKP